MPEIKKHIPNSLTLFNIGVGLASILLTLSGNYQKAAGLILVSVIVDVFDGYIARRLNSTSKIGGYLDTISDFISFGLSTGLLMYWLYDIHPLIILFFVFASAFRLLYFMQTKTSTHFYGVPTTTCGGYLASIAIIRPETSLMGEMLLIMSLLMLSRKKYYRLEIKNKKTTSFILAVLLSIYVLDFMLAIQAVSYMFFGYIVFGWLRIKDR